MNDKKSHHTNLLKYMIFYFEGVFFILYDIRTSIVYRTFILYTRFINYKKK